MTKDLEQLIHDTVDLTGASPPELLDQHGPTLAPDALAQDGFYLIGLIGGKDVGKSALVNALVGEPITQTTSFGPGTDAVLAYAHQSVTSDLAQLLDRLVPGQYRIISHKLSHLTRQVLLDLPDIDSHWESHVQITRAMLRYMLFPLWVQSVEKYADRQPQQLLAKVAEGNSAINFIFCLNKADQLAKPDVEELRQDFSQRIARLLSIDPPRVWILSAAHRQEFDLPALATLLSQQKPGELVRQSQQLAGRQQDRSLLLWLETQDLSGRAQRLKRLQEEAEELLATRIGVPLLEQSLPALAEDPASRLALTDEILAARTRRWPIVGLIHTLLTPALMVIRRNVGAVRTASLPDAEALVEAHLQTNGKPLRDLLRSLFAQLQQTHPQMSQLYQRRKLWDDHPADAAAAQIRAILTETVAAQRDIVRKRLAGKRGALLAPFRWLLTIGALLWFPFIQPITQTLLTQDLTHSTHDIVLLTVRIFSVNELLQNLTFLGMYFFLLWIILRWDTQRQVARFATRWKTDTSDLSLTTQAMTWMDDLLKPIKEARQQAQTLAEREQKLRTTAA